MQTDNITAAKWLFDLYFTFFHTTYWQKYAEPMLITFIMHRQRGLTGLPAACRSNAVSQPHWITSKCMHRSLNLLVYVRSIFIRTADEGSETLKLKDVTGTCFTAVPPVCPCKIESEPSEIRNVSWFHCLLSFQNGENALISRQQGCHIFASYNQITKQIYIEQSKHTTIMDLHFTFFFLIVKKYMPWDVGSLSVMNSSWTPDSLFHLNISSSTGTQWTKNI